MSRRALVAIALMLLAACSEDPSPTAPAGQSSSPSQMDTACASTSEGCLVVEVDEAKEGGRLYVNFVKYGLPEGPPSLARPIRLSPGGGYERKMPPGEYGLLVYRQEAEPSAGEGPECQLNFSIEKGHSVEFAVTYTDGGGCAVTSGSGST